MERRHVESEAVTASESRLGLQNTIVSAGAILLVEDEDFVRNVTCEILRFAGYEVLAARTAADAARVFREQPASIALLLADVVLPDRNGSELAGELRAMQSELKVMLISGYPRARISSLLGPESGFSYLEKPFSAETLVRKISEVLQESAKQPKSYMVRSASGT